MQFVNFTMTSYVRLYGPGGIGGIDLCRPYISFLWWKGFRLTVWMRTIMCVRTDDLWIGCSRMIRISGQELTGLEFVRCCRE